MLFVEIKIDYDLCIRCKKCVRVCSYGVLEWLDDMPIVANPSECAACLDCESVCPVNAITHRIK